MVRKVAFFEIEGWEQDIVEASSLAQYELEFFSEPLTAETIGQARGSQVVSTFIYSSLGAPVLAELEGLELVTTRSTGFDHIDLKACQRQGITVCNVPTYGENTVAEHTFGLILSLSRKIYEACQRTQRGDFSTAGLRGFDLQGKTLGVVGAGRIGLHVIRLGRAFGMEVLVYDVVEHPILAEVLGFRYVTLEELLKNSDIVTLHAPLTKATYHMLNRKTLRQMKPGALLINTARGALVDTHALLEVLRDGHLAGAGLDVLEGEETLKDERQILTDKTSRQKLQICLENHILLGLDNVIVTPHNAFNSQEALERIVHTTIANVEAYIRGAPINVVSAPKRS